MASVKAILFTVHINVKWKENNHIALFLYRGKVYYLEA